MSFYQIFSSRARQNRTRWVKPNHLALSCLKQPWFSLLCAILLSGVLFAACSTQNSTNNPTPGTVNISAIHWCGKPLMIFRDEASPSAPSTGTPTASTPTASTPTAVATSVASVTPTVKATATPSTGLTPANGTPTTINDWKVVKANLGFAVFLPTTLPTGTCLMSASGTLRDPIFGSNFTIGYLLPNHDSISLSEAPLRSQNILFQCSASVSSTLPSGSTKGGTPTPAPTTSQAPMQLCTGVQSTTNIVFSARGTTKDLQTFFRSLKPDVNWVPAS